VRIIRTFSKQQRKTTAAKKMRNKLFDRIFIRNFRTFNLLRNTLNDPGVKEKLVDIPAIKLAKENLKNIDPKAMSKIQEMYIEKLNARNNERFLKEKRLQKHYRITGSILMFIALSIYGYTMFAIRQEKFLDDFDEPEAPNVVTNNKK
jgi:hypothetical protein